MSKAASDSDLKTAPIALLLSTAGDIVQQIESASTVFDAQKEAIVPRFTPRELFLGRIVGRGGFCIIREITAVRLPTDKRSVWGKAPSSGSFFRRKKKEERQSLDASMNGGDINSREYIASRCLRAGHSRYVIKRVAEEWVYQSRITFLKGTVDLAVEAKYLSSLSHPNIVELRGMSSVGPFEEGFFLVMDRLHETLPKKLRTWTTKDRQCKGITGAITGGKKKMSDLLIARLKVAYDIANAIGYLHQLRIVYRDLKPDNVGFDFHDKCKIFDFGLAKELRESERTPDDMYRMTGFTGSIRYMAPEVGRKQPYNEKVDVYSFSILLWYIMALEPPYGFYTPEMLVSRVFEQGHRPCTLVEWPDEVSLLMKRCWDARVRIRPDFDEVMSILQKEVASIDPQAALFMKPHAPQST